MRYGHYLFSTKYWQTWEPIPTNTHTFLENYENSLHYKKLDLKVFHKVGFGLTYKILTYNDNWTCGWIWQYWNFFLLSCVLTSLPTFGTFTSRLWIEVVMDWITMLRFQYTVGYQRHDEIIQNSHLSGDFSVFNARTADLPVLKWYQENSIFTLLRCARSIRRVKRGRKWFSFRRKSILHV